MIDDTHPDAEWFDRLDATMDAWAPLEVTVSGEMTAEIHDRETYERLVHGREIGDRSWERDRAALGHPRTVRPPEARPATRPLRAVGAAVEKLVIWALSWWILFIVAGAFWDTVT